MDFIKLHGLGNDFIVTESSQLFSDSDVSFLCDRHKGIGADGIMVVRSHLSGVFKIEMRNADGSNAAMCGNGIRCVVRYCYLRGLISNEVTESMFTVFGREIVCSTSDQGKNVRVNMGMPSFEPSSLPLTRTTEIINEAISVDSGTFVIGTAVAVGSPHFIVFDRDRDIPLMQELERNKIFKDRSNIEFVQIVRRNLAKVSVWERGAGETLACGTGACAVLAAGVRSDRMDRIAEIELPGGTLLIEWPADNGPIYMTGPAEEVYRGIWN